MKKRLVLILNGKGGVGKSFFAVNFIQYLKDRQFPHAAFDSDNENSTLKRFHPEAGFLNLASPRGLDPMIQSLDGSNLVIVDCRAASTDLFFDFFTNTDLPALLAGLDAALTLAMPVGAELDSIEQIQRLIHELADRCQYLVIRNAVHNDTFALFEASKVRHRLKTELGAKEITMSRMQNWLVDGLNRNNMTPTAARQSGEFSLLDRQRLIMWQRRLYEQIDSAVDLLLPGKVVTRTNHETGAA
jgi:hypothetical protein